MAAVGHRTAVRRLGINNAATAALYGGWRRQRENVGMAAAKYRLWQRQRSCNLAYRRGVGSSRRIWLYVWVA
jgi:hypothetical protein